MAEMERVSLAIEPELLARFDASIARSGGNRSEAMRDLIRARLIEEDLAHAIEGEAIASLTLLYEHGRRDLAERLLAVGHDAHHAILSSMHVHLDHDFCLEILAMRGAPEVLRETADRLLGLRGVIHGRLVMSRLEP